MRMLVLGAGLQGSACAYDLLQNPAVTEVRLADLRVAALAPFLAPYTDPARVGGGKPRLIPTPLDARDGEAVRALMHASACRRRAPSASPSRASSGVGIRRGRSPAVCVGSVYGARNGASWSTCRSASRTSVTSGFCRRS